MAGLGNDPGTKDVNDTAGKQGPTPVVEPGTDVETGVVSVEGWRKVGTEELVDQVAFVAHDKRCKLPEL